MKIRVVTHDGKEYAEGLFDTCDSECIYKGPESWTLNGILVSRAKNFSGEYIFKDDLCEEK